MSFPFYLVFLSTSLNEYAPLLKTSNSAEKSVSLLSLSGQGLEKTFQSEKKVVIGEVREAAVAQKETKLKEMAEELKTKKAEFKVLFLSTSSFRPFS